MHQLSEIPATAPCSCSLAHTLRYLLYLSVPPFRASVKVIPNDTYRSELGRGRDFYRPGVPEVLAEAASRKTPRQHHLGQSRVVLGKVLMIIGVVDRQMRVFGGQALGFILTVNVVIGATVVGGVGRLVDNRFSPGVGTGLRDVPKGTAEVDNSECAGN